VLCLFYYDMLYILKLYSLSVQFCEPASSIVFTAMKLLETPVPLDVYWSVVWPSIQQVNGKIISSDHGLLCISFENYPVFR